MKKKSLLFLLSLMMIGGMAFVSCSDDDDKDDKGKVNPKAILGAWDFGWEDLDNGSKVRLPLNNNLTDPNKAKMKVAYWQDLRYFEDNGRLAQIRVYYDKNKHYLYYNLAISKYEIIGNTVNIIFEGKTMESFTFSVKKNTLTATYSDGSELVCPAIDKNEVFKYIDYVKNDVVGVWDNGREELPDGWTHIIYMRYYDTGAVDGLDVYFDGGLNYQKSYIYHGKWSFNNLIFKEEINGPSPDLFLMLSNEPGNNYLYEHYYDNNNNVNEYSYKRCDMNDPDFLVMYNYFYVNAKELEE